MDRPLKLRKEVEWFAGHMEQKLRENDARPGWKNSKFGWLLERLITEVKELGVAWMDAEIRKHEYESSVKAKALLWSTVIREAADVANFAMMIADNARRQKENLK